VTNHPDEALLSTYVDDALEGAPRNELETHLVGCRDCRTRIVALRDESAFLGDVLKGHERPVHTPATLPETEASVAFSVPIAIAAVAMVFGVASALLESQIPGGLDLFNPLRLKGATEMAFDFIFFLRDAAPGLIELLLALGAVASVSALLSFGAGLLYRHLFGAAAALLLCIASLCPDPASAVVVNVDDDVHVAAGETIEESMVLTGERARIDGTVKGDVVAAVERLHISGRIEGNLYVFTRDLDLTGSIGGTLHTVSERARIDGEIEGGCMAVTQSFTFTPEGRVERDAWLLLHRAVLDGSFGHDVLLGGESFELSRAVARNLGVRFVEDGIVRSGARIGGDLDAWIGTDDDFERDPGAQIGGELNLHEREDGHGRYLNSYLEPSLYLIHAITFSAAFAFGLLVYALLPGVFEVGIRTSRDFFRSLLMGFVLLVVPPCAIVLTGLTLVGLPAAVLAGFLYLTCLYGAELLVGVWLGRTLMGREDATSLWSFGRVFFVGLAIVSVVSHLPFVGPPIAVISLLVGLGLVFERARQLPVFARG
jgi:cytoskeletal protein CcmA (bactofilin family)